VIRAAVITFRYLLLRAPVWILLVMIQPLLFLHPSLDDVFLSLIGRADAELPS
jgi:hypothetical protein